MSQGKEQTASLDEINEVNTEKKENLDNVVSPQFDDIGGNEAFEQTQSDEETDNSSTQKKSSLGGFFGGLFKNQNPQSSAQNGSEFECGNKPSNFGRFTALGSTGTGKTCFMLGIYDKLMAGNVDTNDPVESAFSLSLQNNEQLNDLKTKWTKLFYGKGNDRYPSGTKEYKEYKFSFNANLKEIQEFEWIDYKGGIVDDVTNKAKIKDAITTADVLYIFVDGNKFVPENKIGDYEEYLNYCKRQVSNECSKKIFPFIHLYPENNAEIPPVAIVVTKYDMIINSFREYECIDSLQDHKEMRIKITDEINNIIKSSFPVLFAQKVTSASDKLVGIFPVSIGLNISDEGDSGEFKPCQIQAPIYFGLCCLLEKFKKKSTDKGKVFEALCKQMEGLKYLDRVYLTGENKSEDSLELSTMITKFYEKPMSEKIKRALNTDVTKLFR